MLRKGRTRYVDGTVYEGTYNKDKREGAGVCRYPDGSTYEGQWLGDVREGQGTLTYKDGSYYKGGWKNNLRHGKGVLDILGKAYYEGEFECGDYHGSGELKTPAFTYKGNFIKGLFHGQGELVTSEYKYVGNFIDGEKTGEGRMEYKDGAVYIGGFHNGIYNGPGKLLLPDGGIYEAKFASGKIEDSNAQYITKSTDKYPSKHTVNTILSLLEPDNVSTFSDYFLFYGSDLYTGIWNTNMEPLVRFISSCISPRLIVSYVGSIKAGVLDGACDVEYDNHFSLQGKYAENSPSSGTITFKYTGDLAILDASEADALQFLKLSITFSQYSNNVLHGSCSLSLEFMDKNGNSLTYRSRFTLDPLCRRQGELSIICNKLYFNGTVRDDRIIGEGTLSITYNPGFQAQIQESSMQKSSAIDSSIIHSFIKTATTSKMGRSSLPENGLAVVYKGGFLNGLRSGVGTQQAGNLYHYVGTFKDDKLYFGVLTDYMCSDKVTGEHIARRTIGSFKNNTPQCPVLIEIDTFRYRVYCSAPERFPSIVTVEMRKICLKTSLSTSQSAVGLEDDPSRPISISQLRPLKRGDLRKFTPSYFVVFYEQSTGNLEEIVTKIQAGQDINDEYATLADIRTKNLTSAVFDPGNFTHLIPQFYAGTLEDMRLTGIGVMYYYLPSAQLSVMASGTFIDGYLSGLLDINVRTHKDTASEYASLSHIESAYLVCEATITGTYQNSIMNGDCSIDIIVQSSEGGTPELHLLYSGTYQLGRRQGMGSFALKRDDVLILEYSGFFESDVPARSGSITIQNLGVISGTLTSTSKPEIYRLSNYFSLARYQKLLDLLGSGLMLSHMCTFQGKVNVLLDDNFITENLGHAIGSAYYKEMHVKFIGFIDDNMTLYGEDVEITSDTFVYHGSFKDNKLTGKGVLAIYSRGSEEQKDQLVLAEKYDGTFLESMRDGDKCNHILPLVGEEYVGAFKDNVRHGLGRLLLHATGDVYEGNFINGKLEGHGVITYGTGNELGMETYVGSFENGVPSANGKLSFTDGSWYEGNFVLGERTGIGTFYNKAEDLLIEGYFENGKPSEKTCYTFKYSVPQSRRVIKEVQQSIESGGMIYTVIDANYRYVGELQDGLFHGEGTLEYKNGISYTGTFSNGEFSGLGKLINPVYNYSLTALFFKGDISRSNPYSMLIYDNQSENTYLPHKCIRTYMGPMSFRDKIDRSDDKSFDYCISLGTAEDPYDFTLTPSNISTVHYANGDIYRGGFYSDKRHGPGKAFSAASGVLVIGSFRNDKLYGEETILTLGGEIETGQYVDGEPTGKHVKFINGTSNRFRVIEEVQEQGDPKHIICPLQPIILETTFFDGVESQQTEIVFKSSDCRYIGEYVYGVFYGNGKIFSLSDQAVVTVSWALKRLPTEFKEQYANFCLAFLTLLNTGHTDPTENLYLTFNNVQEELDAQAAALTNARITPTAHRGKLVYGNADYYMGEILDCMRHGKGSLYSGTGDLKYEGEYLENKRNGRGKLMYNAKKYYIGEFRDDLRHGKGEMKYPNNSVYTGTYTKDLRNGIGQMTFPDGSRYDGSWQENEMWGVGLLVYKDGDMYEGEFAHNMKHGKGIMHLINGDILDGTFFQDILEGPSCKITYANGDYYEGEVAAGMPHGKGRRICTNGEEYTGEFKYGQYSGQGTLKYANGDVYVGQFTCNNICGKGVMTYANGAIFEGEWIV